VFFENLVSPLPPSTLKYSVVPPLPSSHRKLISSSSANCLINKVPVILSIILALPLWNIFKSLLFPNLPSAPSICFVFLENLVCSALPSNLRYSVIPPLPSSQLNTIS